MKLIPPQLEIKDGKGFENTDLFDRKPFAESLTNLITNIDDPLVISLDAPWGEGKTVFVKQWQGLLQEQGISSLYFDAFAGDYQEDAFLAISAEIFTFAKEHLDSKDVEHQERGKKFKKTAVGVSKALLKAGTKTTLKAVTLGALDGSEIEDAQKDIAAELGKVTDKLIDDALEKHQESKESFIAFQEALGELAEVLSEDGKPFVIVVDELDRCRPDFALELLEKIKHVFSIRNMVFVLSNNSVQLEESIRCAYGPGIDAHAYLQKFITVSVKLPKEVDGGYKRYGDTRRYIDYLFEQMELEAHGYRAEYTMILRPLCADMGLTLRQIEKVISSIALYNAFIGQDWINHYYLVCGYSFIKELRPKLFKLLAEGKATYPDVANFFRFENYKGEDAELERFKGWWQYVFERNEMMEEGGVAYCEHFMRVYGTHQKNILKLTLAPMLYTNMR